MSCEGCEIININTLALWLCLRCAKFKACNNCWNNWNGLNYTKFQFGGVRICIECAAEENTNVNNTFRKKGGLIWWYLNEIVCYFR